MANLQIKLEDLATSSFQQLSDRLANPAPLYKIWANHLEKCSTPCSILGLETVQMAKPGHPSARAQRLAAS
jgi:hypothetical protein